MQEFFVANNRVDIPRNQIIREGEVIALEPKVLEVLKVLAEHQGEVVSHQTLLDAVWSDIVVAPNALQRCIGQLRKALGDDGKTQKVIATHPKRGYSLLAPVTIRSDAPIGETKSVALSKSNAKNLTFIWLAAVLLAACCSVFLVTWVLQPVSTPLQKFTHLQPLTATDASEFYSTFSPDGRYVAFSRKVTGLTGHMWLLDRETGREIRLTEKPGQYGKPNWSADGQHMAFLETGTCYDSCRDNRCADIDVIFIPLALSEPQPVKKLMACAAIPFLGLEWLNEQHLAAIIHSGSGNNSDIIQINSHSGKTQYLLKAEDTLFYALSFSQKNQYLAVMQVEHEQNPSMFLFSPESGEVIQQPFTPPTRYNSNVQWSPIWDPSGEYLLFSASARLYLMDLQGNLHSQVIPTFEDISYPMYHPDGTSIAMTLGKIDTDVAELTLTQSADNEEFTNSYIENPFARSILRESHGQYQPNGDKIAFFSRRGGPRQIWLIENNDVTQLSDIKDLFPEHFVWSPNGQHIAVSTERNIILLDLDGNMEFLETPFATTSLYQWLPGDKLLMQISDSDGVKLVAYDIKHNSYQLLQKEQTGWAQSDGVTTWFVDSNKQLKHLQDGKSELVQATAHIQMGARFFLRNQQLFMLSNQDDVWQLKLENQKLTRLFHYPDTTVWLTDVSEHGKQMLISKQLSAKKEIVLLTP